MPDRTCNIVLIHSDQHRFDCLGCNGHPLLRTPNLDRLAAEGVNFAMAFTPSPICSPERASLLTGLWPIRHGCLSIPNTELYRPALDGLPTFSQVLRERGYRLGYVGRFHQELRGDPRDYGFDDYLPLGEYNLWRQGQGLPDMPQSNGWFGQTDPHIRPSQSRLAWGADRTIETIERYAAVGKPFLVRWDPVEPHLPNVVPEPYASMYPPQTIRPWTSFPDSLEGKPYIQHQQRRTWKVDGWPWQRWAPIVSRYLGEVTLMDEQIGRVLAAIDRLGLCDNTLVVYTTDHGDMCGAHGMMDKHFIMYDDVVRVPLIARLPGLLPAGGVCDAFVCHALDLAATFCELAGAPAPKTFQGRSLLGVAAGADSQPRQDIFSMWHGGQLGSFTQRMVRDRRWKYVWNASAEDELYDLQADPAELVNRAADGAVRDELARLRRRLAEWMEQVGDFMLNPWTRAQLLDNTKV